MQHVLATPNTATAWSESVHKCPGPITSCVPSCASAACGCHAKCCGGLDGTKRTQQMRSQMRGRQIGFMHASAVQPCSESSRWVPRWSSGIASSARQLGTHDSGLLVGVRAPRRCLPAGLSSMPMASPQTPDHESHTHFLAAPTDLPATTATTGSARAPTMTQASALSHRASCRCLPPAILHTWAQAPAALTVLCAASTSLRTCRCMASASVCLPCSPRVTARLAMPLNVIGCLGPITSSIRWTTFRPHPQTRVYQKQVTVWLRRSMESIIA